MPDIPEGARGAGFVPLTVSYDSNNDVVTVDSMKFTGDFFRYFADPDPSKLYRFTVIEGVTSVEESGLAANA